MNITYKSTKINYVKSGSGENAIVFLHGWGGSIDSFIAVSERTNFNGIKLIIDFPPFGRSETPKKPWILNDYSEIVKKIVDKHKVKKVVFVSHSFGSRVAICFCNRYTTYVNKMIITGGAGVRPKSSLKRFFRKMKYKIIKFFNKNANVGSSDYIKLCPLMKKTFSNIVTTDLSEMSKTIKCPVLLIYGDKDKQTPLYMAKVYNKNMVDSHLIIFKKCGHFAYLEQFNKFISITNIFIKETI